ncbi:hypothetical protein, partial [Acinetobacter brisouii]|uniref:hypothetical protein n=1 Tax=Acinetobacter brisouii TaxID=396323 RepID=UPI0035B2DF63
IEQIYRIRSSSYPSCHLNSVQMSRVLSFKSLCNKAVRDLISTHSKRVKNSKEFIEFNQKIIEEIHQDEVQEVEKIHQEEVKKDDDIEAMLEKIRQEELLLATNNKGEN